MAKKKAKKKVAKKAAKKKTTKKAAKKAPVDITAKVTETLEALTAPKNANQCKAMSPPATA